MEVLSGHGNPKPPSQARLAKVTAASLKANLAMKNSDWPEAIKRWQAIVDEFGSDAPANVWINLSDSLRRLQKYTKAEAITGEGIEKYPNSLGLKIQFAEIPSARQDWPEAIKRWQAILDKVEDKSRLATVYSRLCAVYLKIGNYEKAEAIILEGLRYHPQNPAVKIAYAKIASARQDWPEAIKRWQATLDQLGNDAPADGWLGLIVALRNHGKPDQANQKLADALVLYPNSLKLAIEHAELANTSQDWPEAIKCWQAILDKEAATRPMGIANHLYVRFNISILKRLVDIAGYKDQIKKYRASTTKRKIAVYTSFTKGYDDLKLPEIIDDRFDYIVYSDAPIDGMGVFDVRPLNQPAFAGDGSRATRYPKTHPHVLLKGYDVAIWMDTSLMITGDLIPLINDFLKSGKPIGNATHPSRESLDEEIEACIDLRKDDPKILKRQLDYYRSIGFNTKDLANNGVLIFDINNEKLAPVMETWWKQICTYSKRDQLSFNYSLFKNSAERFRLTKPPEDIKNHPAIVFTPHHADPAILKTLYEQLSNQDV